VRPGSPSRCPGLNSSWQMNLRSNPHRRWEQFCRKWWLSFEAEKYKQRTITETKLFNFVLFLIRKIVFLSFSVSAYHCSTWIRIKVIFKVCDKVLFFKHLIFEFFGRIFLIEMISHKVVRLSTIFLIRHDNRKIFANFFSTKIANAEWNKRVYHNKNDGFVKSCQKIVKVTIANEFSDEKYWKSLFWSFAFQKSSLKRVGYSHLHVAHAKRRLKILDTHTLLSLFHTHALSFLSLSLSLSFSHTLKIVLINSDWMWTLSRRRLILSLSPSSFKRTVYVCERACVSVCVRERGQRG